VAAIEVTLDWAGVWEVKEYRGPYAISDEEGIYMVLCGKRGSDPNQWSRSSYALLYIGEAEHMRTAIVEHEKWLCWEKNCTEHMLLKVAKCELGITKREEAERCLVYNLKPPCNEDCIGDFLDEGESILVTSTGMREPLQDSYSYPVAPTIPPAADLSSS